MAKESQRKQIRHCVKSLLLGIEGIGDRVFTNRAKKMWKTEYPAIIIYTKNEPAEIRDASPRKYRKSLSLVIELLLKIDKEDQDNKETEDILDDSMDDFCEIIEQRIFANETLNGLVSDTILTNTEMDHGVDGDSEIAGAQLTFECTYDSLAPAETEELADFETASVTWSEKADSEVAETPKDTIELET